MGLFRDICLDILNERVEMSEAGWIYYFIV